MKFGSCQVSLLFGGLAAALASGQACVPPNGAQNALAFAYQYGYPLYAYGVFLRPYNKTAETNKLYHQEKLASPGAIDVVRPNVDTVYSILFLDLSASNLLLTIPEFDDRYWAQSFFDLYGNNVANIGNIGKYKPGRYIVRYDPDHPGVQTDDVPEGFEAYVNVNTPYGTSITRILLKAEPRDLENVRQYQAKISLSVQQRCDELNIPAFNLSIFTDPDYSPGPNVSVELAILRLTAAFSRLNQPIVPENRTWVARRLAKAGITDNSFRQPGNTNLTKAAASANDSVKAFLATPEHVRKLGNNWTLIQPIGSYGSLYQARYFIAAHGYLALTIDQTAYPSTSDLTLGPQEAFVLRFARMPRVSAGGFWSLTVYNEDQLLITNRWNRYALGDRSNLINVDGKPISEDPGRPFDILIQPSAAEPPSNWTNNWIPISAEGGVFSISLRFYGAEAEMMNGSYIYPKFQLQQVIRA